MIPLLFLKYEKNYKLDFQVTRFVNDKILEILTMLRDIERDDPSTDNPFGLVPQGCYRNPDFSYEQKLNEINDLLSDNLLRTGIIELSPLNQYVIYRIIKVCIEISGDDSGSTIISIPDNLKSKIEDCTDYYIWSDNPELIEQRYYNLVEEEIEDYRNYLDFLFDDWDFLEECATKYAVDCLINPSSKFNQYGLEEIEEFLPMVADDIYDKFKEMLEKNMEKGNTKTTISVNGDNNTIINTGSAQDIRGESVQADTASNKAEKKSLYEKYSIGTIIAALIGLFGVILTIIFNS